MSAKRVMASNINWTAFAARVPKDQQSQFKAFKAKSDSYLKQVEAYPESLQQINWQHYSRINVPGLVENFKKRFESLQVPYPKDTYTERINEAEKKAMADVKIFVKESQDRILKTKAELKKYEEMIPPAEMCKEEFAVNFPHLITYGFERPSIAPHNPEVQPGYVPPKEAEEEQH